MTVANLKKSLGEGGAFIGDSHGDDRLLDVLTALAEVGETLNAQQSTIATAVLAGMVVDRDTRLSGLSVNVGTTGTATQTDVDVNVNGVQAGQLVVDNTDADGVSKSVALDVALKAGDLVELEVTAAPTAGADLTATARMAPVKVEA